MFAVVPQLTGCFQEIPVAKKSRYVLLTTSLPLTGAVETVAVVKAADDGVVAPIVVLLMVLFVMFRPDWLGLIVAKTVDSDQ